MTHTETINGKQVIFETVQVAERFDHSVSALLDERKQWYLDNEYKYFKGELPPFIKLKLDTDLRRDKSVFDWLYSRNLRESEQSLKLTLDQAIEKAKPNMDKIKDVDAHLNEIK